MSSVFSQHNLQIFSFIVRYGSFAKAAEELGLTASAVSHAIKRTEKHLGVALFERTTRSIELTDAGYYFYRKATNLLADFYSIERSLSSIEQGIERKINICINSLMHTPYHTSILLDKLKTHFPSCQIAITIEVYNGVWDALLNKNADIAIGAPGTLIDGGGIDYMEIGNIQWKFVLPLNHPLTKAVEPITEGILAAYPSIFIEDTAYEVRKQVGWLLQGQEVIKVPDWETKKNLQLQGVGIGFLPDYLVRNELKEQNCVERKINNPRQPSRMLLAIKHDLKGKVSQWIQEEFQQGGELQALYSDILHKPFISVSAA